jgi:hypothetical protein
VQSFDVCFARSGKSSVAQACTLLLCRVLRLRAGLHQRLVARSGSDATPGTASLSGSVVVVDEGALGKTLRFIMLQALQYCKIVPYGLANHDRTPGFAGSARILVSFCVR